MFANLIRLITRRAPPPDYAQGFVREVNISSHPVRLPRVERLILICWILILIKSVVVLWACAHYHTPFNALWVIAPTLLFAGLCTAVYYWRD